VNGLHPLVERAAEGRLPEWAVASEPRRAHIGRVVELLESWGEGLGLEARDRARLRAAGTLHDALREADPEALRPRVPPPLATLPGPLLHGPAAAERLRIEGVDDGELLRAVGYHTIGHPGFRALGKALYAADFLEPGRRLRDEWRAGLRDRMPRELDAVVRDILGARIAHLVEIGGPLREETWAFWNALAREPS